MKTKPFNLEECLAGKPMVTRGGKKVKFIGINEDSRKSIKIEENGIVFSYSKEGKFIYGDNDCEDLLMLVEESEQHKTEKETIKLTYTNDLVGTTLEASFSKDVNDPFDECFLSWLDNTLKAFGLPEGGI